MCASIMEHLFTIYSVIRSYHVYNDECMGRSSLLREMRTIAILACAVSVKRLSYPRRHLTDIILFWVAIKLNGKL